MPAHSLRRMLALQTELMKGAGTPISSAIITGPASLPPSAVAVQPQGRQNHTQRTLLSANFTSPLQNGTRAANLLGRNLLSAGDKIRDLIVPDALAALVTAPTWIPGIGGGRRIGNDTDGGKKVEKLRAELDDLLASSCPLCESVVVGLDKPFITEGEVDTTWTL